MRALAPLILFLGAAAAASARAEGCPPPGWSAARLTELKAKGFALADDAMRQTLAVGLLGCLGAPDPALRDGIAFEALSAWMRADRVDVATRRILLARLPPLLDGQDVDGFRAPFAALVLSEVIRTDRISPWMEPEERHAVAADAAAFLAGIRDYRGFVDGQGWRHGVAHGADLVLQLALDPAVAGPDLPPLLAAIGAQARTDRHAYIHGEPERLARAVLYLARRPELDEAHWQAWFETLSAPAPAATWQDALGSEAGLARRHNLRAFLLALHAGSEGSDQAAWQALDRRARAALEAMP